MEAKRGQTHNQIDVSNKLATQYNTDGNKLDLACQLRNSLPIVSVSPKGFIISVSKSNGTWYYLEHLRTH